ncbi:AraC family transcriptional regulator [Alteromonas sp. 1_MG-2023]|uniref:AraC family transcriptional regulator n=1 Tax=Alteromonas sp. 1_MG-2023 TaxID=3062669 RepID=UPI0026E2B044|nr:AraC family transcriptional regulator [Alteromonas sp. 1_MG-2023]MDO6474513.1 AraC family transcriptional regulator [Alteromonas sp. 1_MG-2023]
MGASLALCNQMKQLATGIAVLTEREGYVDTPVPGLTVFKKTGGSEPLAGYYEPSVCLIAQGAKRVQLGDESYVYDTEHYLFSGVHLPVVAQVIDASEEVPYLGLKLTFNYQEITQLMTDSQLPPPKGQRSGRGMATGCLTAPLVGVFQRLIDLATDETQHIETLAPLARREIFYRLLVGEQGETLRQLAAMGTQTHQVARAIAWLKSNYAETIRVEALADIANMGISTFHHHFRNMTAMSPLQFIKRIRLQEARRLMLTEHLDAATAAFQVGYESPSQFSREYGRLYGCSPAKDVNGLRFKFASAAN